MSSSTADKPNVLYITGVSVILTLLPLISVYTERFAVGTPVAVISLSKWFIFYAVGLRLSIAGFRQSFKPAFTARAIFHIEGTEADPVIRELGFANICLGITGLISLWIPEWRITISFTSGLYYGLAGFMHAFRKGKGVNEWFALYTDLVVFVLLAAIVLYRR